MGIGLFSWSESSISITTQIPTNLLVFFGWKLAFAMNPSDLIAQTVHRLHSLQNPRWRSPTRCDCRDCKFACVDGGSSCVYCAAIGVLDGVECAVTVAAFGTQ